MPASLRNYRPLKLMAIDAEDLRTVSAILQDAVFKIGDISYSPGERRFVFVANRFIWECTDDDRNGPYGRVRVGVSFSDVLSVQRQNIRADAKNAIVDLLSIRFEDGADGTGIAFLEFAGGGGLKLSLESINVRLEDITEPWITPRKPTHEGGEANVEVTS
ncbi:MAG: DUF2948 family protein [Pseudomonadota bacterium]